MKKFFSIIFGMIIFICLFVLTIIINLNFLFKEKTINNINKNMDYMSFVNVAGKKDNINNIIDSTYEVLIKSGMSYTDIKNAINSKYLKSVVSKIEVDEINYLFYGKKSNALSKNDLKNMQNKYIKDKKIILALNFLNPSILEIERNINKNIDSIPNNNLKVVRYLFTNDFKIILLTLITISCVLIIIINKEKFIPYIFVPSCIVGIIELLIVLFADNYLYKYLSGLVYVFILPFVKQFTGTLLKTSLIIMCISVFYLLISDNISEKSKVILKKRIKIKND